jgi:hypothetical protein
VDFGGDLTVLEPALVFQIVNMAGITGELKFVTPESVASFYFKSGELIYATIDTRKKKLGEFLVENGRITREQLDVVLREHATAKERGRIGNSLIARKYLDYETLVAAVSEQIKEVVYEVLAWKQGQFLLMKNILPKDEDILLDVKLDYLILVGLKRIDEADE